MADCTRKLQATVSAAVESLQTGFYSLIVQHVRFNDALTLLFDLQYKQQLIRTARGQWHHCFIWCRVVQARDVSPNNFDGLAMSGLAFSVAPSTFLSIQSTNVAHTVHSLKARGRKTNIQTYNRVIFRTIIVHTFSSVSLLKLWVWRVFCCSLCSLRQVLEFI